MKTVYTTARVHAIASKLRNEYKFETIEYAPIMLNDEKEVVGGKALFNRIVEDYANLYLVSKVVFDELKSLGFKNIVMFDPMAKVGNSQGGLIHP